jgi:hypothetical protein
VSEPIPLPEGKLPLAKTVVDVPGHGGHEADNQTHGGAEQNVAKSMEVTASREQQLGSHGGKETTQAENGADQTEKGGNDDGRLQKGLGKTHLHIAFFQPSLSSPVTLTPHLPPLVLERPAPPPPQGPEAKALKTHCENANGKKDQQPACGPTQGTFHSANGSYEDFMQTGRSAPVSGVLDKGGGHGAD